MSTIATPDKKEFMRCPDDPIRSQITLSKTHTRSVLGELAVLFELLHYRPNMEIRGREKVLRLWQASVCASLSCRAD